MRYLIFNFILDFKRAFFNPLQIENYATNKKGNTNLFIVYYILSLLVLLFLSIWSVIIIHFFKIPSNIKINEFSFLLIAIRGPFLEELFFRGLLKLKKVTISLFVGMLTYYLWDLVLINILFNYLLCLISSIAVYMLFDYIFKDYSLPQYNKNQLLIIIYFSSIVFGLAHLINFKVSIEVLPIMLVFVFPKIVSGFLLSTLRLKFGLYFSFLLHFSINSIFFCLSYLK